MVYHPDDEALSAWFDGEANQEECAALGVHLGGCSFCRERLDEIAGIADLLVPLSAVKPPARLKTAWMREWESRWGRKAARGGMKLRFIGTRFRLIGWAPAAALAVGLLLLRQGSVPPAPFDRNPTTTLTQTARGDSDRMTLPPKITERGAATTLTHDDRETVSSAVGARAGASAANLPATGRSRTAETVAVNEPELRTAVNAPNRKIRAARPIRAKTGYRKDIETGKPANPRRPTRKVSPPAPAASPKVRPDDEVEISPSRDYYAAVTSHNSGTEPAKDDRVFELVVEDDPRAATPEPLRFASTSWEVEDPATGAVNRGAVMNRYDDRGGLTSVVMNLEAPEDHGNRVPLPIVTPDSTGYGAMDLLPSPTIPLLQEDKNDDTHHRSQAGSQRLYVGGADASSGRTGIV